MTKQITKEKVVSKRKKVVNHGIQFPTAYTILFILTILVAGLTWVMPTGQYDYQDVEGNMLPVPGTYKSVEANPQGFFDIVTAPIKGFYEGIDIILFVLVIGGFLGVVMNTGAINAGISRVVKKMKGKEIWMIPVLMTLFAIGGTTYGMGEECVAFYALIIPVMLAAGFDAMVAVAVILLGSGIGVVASTVNPFATGIASGFAGVPLGDGIGLRLVMLLLGLIVCCFFVMKYAKVVKKDPRKSLVYNLKKSNEEHFLNNHGEKFPEFTRTRKVILALFGLTFLVMIYGVIPFSDLGITALPTLGWWFQELTVLFLVSAIVIGIIDGMEEKSLTKSFVEGAKDLLGVAIIIGIARGVTVIMNAGMITDTVLAFAETAVSGLSSAVFVNVNYWMHFILTFFIPSSSGLATLSMPIMAPLAGFAGVSKALIVTGFEFASGMVNLIAPTSVILMGGLAMGKVPYNKWLKFILPIFIVLTILITVLLSIGTFM